MPNPYDAIDDQQHSVTPAGRNPYEAQHPSPLWDTLATIPSALVRGTNAILGMGADVPNLESRAIDYATGKAIAARKYVASRIAGKPQTWQQADEEARREVARHPAPAPSFLPTDMLRRTGLLDHVRVRGVPAGALVSPTSDELNSGVNSALRTVTKAAVGQPYEMYRPQTAAGRTTQTVVSALPAAAVMGPAGSLRANLAENLPGVVASGLGGSAAREMVGVDSPYAPAAEMAGSLAGGFAGAGAQGWRNMRTPEAVSERAQRIAGQVRREASVNPAQDEAALAAHLASPPPVMAGTRPVTSQVIRTPQEQTLEREVQTLGGKEGIPGTGAATATKQGSRAVLQSDQPYTTGQVNLNVPQLVGQSIQKPDMEAAFALPSGVSNVQADASSRLTQVVRQTEQAMKQREQSAWDALDSQATLNGAPMLDNLHKYVADLSIPNAKRFPSEVRGILDNLTGEYGALDPELALAPPPMPIRQAQDFRRIVGEDANRAYAMGKDTEGRQLREFADLIGKHLEDPDNYNMGSEGAAEAWRNAVDATKAYKQHFGQGFARDVTATTPEGAPLIAPESALDRLISGKNALQSVRNLRAIPDIDTSGIDQAIADWHMGKLSGNGAKFDVPSSKMGVVFSDPKFKALADEVPALRQRADTLLPVAQANDEAGRLGAVVDKFHKVFNDGNPDKLANFMDENRDDLLAATPPTAHPFVQELHNSAQFMRSIPAGQLNTTETLDHLRNGSLLSLIYGRAVGTVSDMLGLGALGEGLQQAAHVLGGTHLGAPLGAGAALLGKGMPALDKVIGRVVLGRTRDEAMGLLQQAADNPELAYTLSQKPSPEAILNTAKLLSGPGVAAAKIGAYTYAHPREPAPDKIEEPVGEVGSVLDNVYDVPTGAPSGDSVMDNVYDVPDVSRPQRASGGRVDDIEPLVNALMTKAKQAKTGHAKATEPLLQVPDNAIASALRVAQAVT